MAEYHPECWETFLRELKALKPAPAVGMPIAEEVHPFPWWLLIVIVILLLMSIKEMKK